MEISLYPDPEIAKWDWRHATRFALGTEAPDASPVLIFHRVSQNAVAETPFVIRNARRLSLRHRNCIPQIAQITHCSTRRLFQSRRIAMRRYSIIGLFSLIATTGCSMVDRADNAIGQLTTANSQIMTANQQLEKMQTELTETRQQLLAMAQKLDQANQNIALTNSKFDKTNDALAGTIGGLTETNSKLNQTVTGLTDTNRNLSRTNVKFDEANSRLSVIDQAIQKIPLIRQ